MQRCKAKSKRSGKQCKNYALKEYAVCRMHGARGGPKSRQGYETCKDAPKKHGMYGQEFLEEARLLRRTLKINKSLLFSNE